MSLRPRSVAGTALGLIVHGFAAAEIAAEGVGGLFALMQKPHYSVGIRGPNGLYFRTELHGGTRSRALERAQEMYPDCQVASLTKLRHGHAGHGGTWGIEH